MTHQQEIELQQPLHLASKTRLVSLNELLTCKSIGDAYYRTFKESGKPRKVVAIETGISASVLSRIFSGTRNMPEHKEQLFYEVCGNYFAYQWKGFQMGLSVDKRDLTTEEKANLYDQIQGVA